MKEVELTEDIRKYEKKAFFGFTLRQGLGLLTASIIGLGINFGFTFIPDTAKGFLALICAFIPILIGFIKPYNMHFEQFAKKIIIYNILPPKVRKYKINNPYYECTKNIQTKKISTKELKKEHKRMYKKNIENQSLQGFK